MYYYLIIIYKSFMNYYFYHYYLLKTLRYILDGAHYIFHSFHRTRYEKLSLPQKVSISELLLISSSFFIRRITAEAVLSIDFMFYFIFYCISSYWNCCVCVRNELSWVFLTNTILYTYYFVFNFISTSFPRRVTMFQKSYAVTPYFF